MNAKSKILAAYREPTLLQTSADLAALDRQGRKANSGLHKFASAAAALVNANFQMADNKALDIAAIKACDEYGGDTRQLTDLCRGSIEVETVEQIAAMQRLFNPERLSPFLLDWASKGYLIRRFKDAFAEPTATGHRALHLKVEIPLSRGDSHIGEIQVCHRGFHADSYALTHDLYEAQRAITRRFNTVALSDSEAAHYAALENRCQAIHQMSAEAHGLTALQKPVIPYHALAHAA